MFKEYDTFLLKQPIQHLTIPVGSKGVVLIVHKATPPAYEVEFADSEGRTLGIVTLTDEFMEPAKP